MDIVLWKTRTRAMGRVIAMTAACSILTSCDDGPSGPRVESNIAGTWRGSLNPGLGRNFDLCLHPASATATIRQEGFRVSGNLTTESADFPGGELEGEFRSGSLTGTLTTSREVIAVTGGATSSQLTVTFFSPGQCGPNSIRLER